MEAILDYIAVIAFILVIVCIAIAGVYNFVLVPIANKMLFSNKHHLIWKAEEDYFKDGQYLVQYMVNEDELNWFERLFGDNSWYVPEGLKNGKKFNSREEFDALVSKFPTMRELNLNGLSLKSDKNVWLWP